MNADPDGNLRASLAGNGSHHGWRHAPDAPSAKQVADAGTLSAVAMKNHELLREVFFRQAWDDVRYTFGRAAEAKMQRLAVMMFKPDALVGRRVRPALSFLAEHGFRPTTWEWIGLDRMLINTIWRFQWNVATVDRLELSELLFCATESLLVYFEDDAPRDDLPSTVRLLGLKGPGRVDLQLPHHLRSAIRTPNRVMSMIHAPDEPIDLVRELGILFDGRRRRALLNRLSANSSLDGGHALDALVRSRESAIRHHDLDWHRSIARYRAMVGSDSQVRTVVELGERAAAATRRGRSLRIWPALSDHLDRTAPALDEWDRVLIGASLVQHNEPGSTCAIDSDGLAEWSAGLGRMVASGIGGTEGDVSAEATA